MKILRIDSSARYAESVGRDLTTRLLDRLNPDGSATVIVRDLASGLSLISEATIDAAFTPVDARTPEQVAELAEGRALIDELESTDVLVISMPIYNFSAPASLKAWADLVARPGQTFAETETGLVGLLKDRPTYIVVTSGGVPIGSPADWATGWLSQFLGFIGITSVEIIDAGQLTTDPEAAIAAARQAIADLPLA